MGIAGCLQEQVGWQTAGRSFAGTNAVRRPTAKPRDVCPGRARTQRAVIPSSARSDREAAVASPVPSSTRFQQIPVQFKGEKRYKPAQDLQREIIVEEG